MPVFLSKDFLSEHLRQQTQFFQTSLLIIPNHLEHVAKYVHLEKNQPETLLKFLLYDAKNEIVDLENKPFDKYNKETFEQFIQDGDHNNFQQCEQKLQVFNRNTHHARKNLVPVDSDLECGLFSSAESGWDDEKQKIVDYIANNLPDTKQQADNMVLEELEDSEHCSCLLNFPSIEKLCANLKPVNVKDPICILKEIVFSKRKLETYVVMSKSDNKINMKFSNIEEKHQGILYGHELEETLFQYGDDNTESDNICIPGISELEREELEELNEIKILETYAADTLHLIMSEKMLENFIIEDKLDEKINEFHCLPTVDILEGKDIHLESPCSEIVDPSPNRYKVSPETKEIFQGNLQFGEDNICLINKESSQKIIRKIRKDDSSYGDMLLMLLPEIESNVSTRCLSFPELPTSEREFDGDLRKALVWECVQDVPKALRSFSCSLYQQKIFISCFHTNLFRNHFKRLMEKVKDEKSDWKIHDWKQDERKYEHLQNLTAFKKNTGFGIPSTKEKKLKDTEPNTLSESIKISSMGPTTKTTIPDKSSKKAKASILLGKSSIQSSKMQKENSLHSPLDSFLLLRTGFKCSTPRDTPKYVSKPHFNAKKMIGVVTPVTSVSAAKVKPMLTGPKGMQSKHNQNVQNRHQPEQQHAPKTYNQQQHYQYQQSYNHQQKYHQQPYQKSKNLGCIFDVPQRCYLKKHYPDSQKHSRQEDDGYGGGHIDGNLYQESLINRNQQHVFQGTRDDFSVLIPVEPYSSSNTDIKTTVEFDNSFSTTKSIIITPIQNQHNQHEKPPDIIRSNESNALSKLGVQKVKTTTETASQESKLHQKLDVPLTREFINILTGLNKDSSSLLEFLKERNCVRQDCTLFTITLEQTRFLIKEEELKMKGRNCTSDQDVYCGLICLHGLSQAVDLIVHCNIPTACGVLKSISQNYQTVLHDCLEPVRKKLIRIHCTNKNQNIYHPKFVSLKEIILGKLWENPSAKIIVLFARYFKQLATALKEFLSTEISKSQKEKRQRIQLQEQNQSNKENSLISVNFYPYPNADQEEYVKVFMSSNVILAEESEDLLTCPWKFFQHVIQFEYRKLSKWDEMLREKNPDLKTLMLNTLTNVLVDQELPLNESLQTDGKEQQHILTCSQRIVLNQQLLIALERQNNIHLIPKQYNGNNIITRPGTSGNIHQHFTTQPDFLLTPSTCIHVVFEEDGVRSNEELYTELVSMILKCSVVHVVFVWEKTMPGSKVGWKDSLTGFLFTSKKHFPHVTIRTWHVYSLQHLAWVVRNISDQCSEQFNSLASLWDSTLWCREDVTDQEMFLHGYPFINTLTAEVMLQKRKNSLKQLTGMSLQELKKAFSPVVPEVILIAFFKAIHSCTSVNPIPYKQRMEFMGETDAGHLYSNLSNRFVNNVDSDKKYNGSQRSKRSSNECNNVNISRCNHNKGTSNTSNISEDSSDNVSLLLHDNSNDENINTDDNHSVRTSSMSDNIVEKNISLPLENLIYEHNRTESLPKQIFLNKMHDFTDFPQQNILSGTDSLPNLSDFQQQQQMLPFIEQILQHDKNIDLHCSSSNILDQKYPGQRSQPLKRISLGNQQLVQQKERKQLTKHKQHSRSSIGIWSGSNQTGSAFRGSSTNQQQQKMATWLDLNSNKNIDSSNIVRESQDYPYLPGRVRKPSHRIHSASAISSNIEHVDFSIDPFCHQRESYKSHNSIPGIHRYDISNFSHGVHKRYNDICDSYQPHQQQYSGGKENIVRFHEETIFQHDASLNRKVKVEQVMQTGQVDNEDDIESHGKKRRLTYEKVHGATNGQTRLAFR